MKAADFNKYHLLPVPSTGTRARCPNCKKRLKVALNRSEDEQKLSDLLHSKRHFRGEIVSWRYTGYGHFCSLRCGTQWANNMIDR